MKKFTKLIVFLLLCLLYTTKANATKKYADLASATAVGNASWDAESNSFAWTASYYAFMALPGLSGDLTEYSQLVVDAADYTDTWRIDFELNDGTVLKGSEGGRSMAYWSANTKTINLAEKFTEEQLSQVKSIRINTNSDAGSVTIKKAYLVKPVSIDFDDNGVAYIDLTDIDYDSNLTFDDQTGELTSNGQGTFSVSLNNEDFSAVTNIQLAYEGNDIVQTLQVIDADNGSLGTFYNSKYNLNFASYQAKAHKITKLSWNCNNAGTMTIKSIKITSNVITASKAGETVLKSLNYYTFPDGNSANVTWNVGTASDTYYGSGSSNANYYVDLTDFEELRIYRDDQTAFRAFFINAAGTGTNPINNNSSQVTWNSEGSYFAIDLTQVEKYNGKVYLNTIKSASYDLKNVVNNIVVYSTPEAGSAQYNLYGSGVKTAGAKAALADVTATVIDATNVTGTAVDLTTANPNCIILAKEGVVANTSNVSVNGTIASLVVTDGYPMEVPAVAPTATAATYSRSMSNRYGTLCLPFNAAASEDVKYYAIDEIDGEELVISEVQTLTAGTPAIIEKVNEDATEITITGDGRMSAAKTIEGDITFTGAFEAQTILAADYEKAVFGVSNDKFVRALVRLNLPAFRAFFTADDEAQSVSIRRDEGLANSIESFTNQSVRTVDAIYSANGIRLNSLSKGLNIMRFSDGTTRKVMVK